MYDADNVKVDLTAVFTERAINQSRDRLYLFFVGQTISLKIFLASAKFETTSSCR